jgi:FkbM family methyltransferase
LNTIKELRHAFQLERAIPHDNTAITGTRPLVFATPPACWAYAVSLPASWPAPARATRERDGSVRLRLRVVDGCVSALALDGAGGVIDEVIVDSTGTPVDVDLVSAPLRACVEVVVRNARSDERPSLVEISSVQCVDLGPSEPPSEHLSAPPGLTLRPVDDWSRYYGARAGRSLPERLRGVRYARQDGVRWMPWLEDLKVRIHPNDDLSRALYVSGLYEPSTLDVLQRVLSPGATFIDVGANAGLFSMFASRRVGPGGRVFAFEPSEREYRRLLDHVEVNRLSNVTAVHQAIGGQAGSVSLRVASFPNAGHNTIGGSFAYPGVETAQIEQVDVVTLDQFVRDIRLARVDAIKMDIEGSEHAALSGSREVLDRFRPAMIVELEARALSGQGATPGGIIDLLGAAQYAVYRIGPAAELIRLAPGEALPEGNVVALPDGQS